MCVSSNAIYFSFHDQIVKTDWYGRLLNRVTVDPHGGDICLWNGRLYTGVWLKPNWIGRLCKKQKLPIYGIVQFVELKGGQVYDFTMHGGGYGKEIER